MPRPRVQVVGPLAVHANGFRQELIEQGYAPRSAERQLALLGHLSRWVEAVGLEPSKLTDRHVEAYLNVRRAQGPADRCSIRGIAPALGYLRRVGAVGPPMPSTVVGPWEALLADYHKYLVEERSLAAFTVGRYVGLARLFLDASPGSLAENVNDLRAAHVGQFMRQACARHSVAWSKQLVSALRSLLRFLHVSGSIDADLLPAVPAVAGWTAGSLPRGITGEHVARLLRSCDRRTAMGRRDYAILVLLVRLGLRAGEVAGLLLDDIDWRRGELVVRGKGRCLERLPMPVDVGSALAAHLRGRRPGGGRAVFVGARAPRRPLSPGAISATVVRASARAGLPRVGAHRLRHSAATALLQSGASLPEVAQVLRHRSTASTAIYAIPQELHPTRAKAQVAWS